MSSAILGSYLIALSVAFTAIFGYLFSLDRDKRKLMFMIAFASNIFMQLPSMVTGWEDMQILKNIYTWGPLFPVSAIFLAVFSSFFNQKSFRKTFKIFLFIAATAVLLIILPFSVGTQPVILYTVLSMITIFVSIYSILKRRNLPDFMFLLATVSFTLAELGKRVLGSEIEFVVFAYTCAHIFIALVFVTSKEIGGSGIATFFTHERELEQTKRELEISQDQLTKAEYNFKSLVDLIAEPVVIVDHKGHFLEINDKVVELTGFSREELLGKNFFKTDIVPLKSKAILIKNLAKRMT